MNSGAVASLASTSPASLHISLKTSSQNPTTRSYEISATQIYRTEARLGKKQEKISESHCQASILLAGARERMTRGFPALILDVQRASNDDLAASLSRTPGCCQTLLCVSSAEFCRSLLCVFKAGRCQSLLCISDAECCQLLLCVSSAGFCRSLLSVSCAGFCRSLLHVPAELCLFLLCEPCAEGHFMP